MLFTMVALWIITIILLVSDARSVNTRWAAALTFTVGVGGLSRVIKDTAIPGLLKYDIYNSQLIDVSVIIKGRYIIFLYFLI